MGDIIGFNFHCRENFYTVIDGKMAVCFYILSKNKELKYEQKKYF